MTTDKKLKKSIICQEIMQTLNKNLVKQFVILKKRRRQDDNCIVSVKYCKRLKKKRNCN